jgi:hypothetical protein
MTRLKNAVLGGIAALAIGGVAGSASAMESGTFQNRLNGATIGLPLGALPPPGLYTGLETAYLGMLGDRGASSGNYAGPNGQGINLPAIAQAVPLLWVPAWNPLGASYGMSVVFAFYNNNGCANGFGGGNCTEGPFSSSSNGVGAGGGYVTANPFFQPIDLSWKLGGGLFASFYFGFMAPIGTHSAGTPNPDYWTFEPGFAISYLSGQWNLTANFFYDINTASKNTCCNGPTISAEGLGAVTSGNALYGDLHALYKFGKWEMGPVGYFEVQTTSDTGGGCGASAGALGNPVTCARYETVALGGLVGYDFGPVNIQVWVTDQLVGQNTPAAVGSIDVWTRLGFRLWAPEAPAAPLVTKN